MDNQETNDKYYQGILQLRNCTEEALQLVMDLIEQEGAKVAKEVKLKDGYDLYITSNKFIKKAGKMLAARFPGILKQSSKLHTEDKQAGKKLYRGTVFFKMPSFKVGDEGMLRGDKVKVLSIGDRVMLQDSKTGKKSSMPFEEVEKHLRL